MKSFFKIFLALAVMFTAIPGVEAQNLIRPVKTTGTVIKDSVVNGTTKYVIWTSTPTGVTGISLSTIKAATGGGTASGYAIVQVRTDTMPTAATSSWIDYVYPGTTKRDTLAFVNDADVHGYQWPVPVQFFNGVRLKIVTSGTQKVYLYGSLLRR